TKKLIGYNSKVITGVITRLVLTPTLPHPHPTTYSVSKPDEIDQYCAMKIPCNLIGKNPMLFWSQKYIQDTLPLLSRYARTIHAIPPTSASTERLFSISGYTFNSRRTNLLPSHLDDILVIRSGLRIKVEKHSE
ncbi:unnamed protein product, partial [Rotaria sp. Silwood2]